MKKIFIIAILTFTAMSHAQETEENTENIPQGWIKVQKDGFYGFIDCEGQETVKPVYEEIEAAFENYRLKQ